MQTGTWLAAIMTSLLVIIDNQYCISHTADTNTGTTITNINIPPVIINDEQKAGTSHDYNGMYVTIIA